MRKGGKKAFDIGQQSEIVVKMALGLLKKDGYIFDFIKVDEPGRDFIVVLCDHRKLNVEVKSSYKQKSVHEKRYGVDSLVIIVFHRHRKLSNEKKRIGDNIEGEYCSERFT